MGINLHCRRSHSESQGATSSHRQAVSAACRVLCHEMYALLKSLMSQETPAYARKHLPAQLLNIFAYRSGRVSTNGEMHTSLWTREDVVVLGRHLLDSPFAVNCTIWQHHGRIVLVHDLPRD